MARKSLRTSAGTAPRSSSKRPTPAEPGITGNLAKRPKRQSTSKATPAKSDYFSHESSGDEAEDEENSEEPDSPGFEGSEPSSSSDAEVESDQSDGNGKPAQRSRGRPQGSTKRAAASSESKMKSTKARGEAGSELWRPGVKTGLGPGTQVVIKKPKARDPGSTPYTDNAIHPNTMLFLRDLAANNDRQWLKMHDPDYRASLQDFNSFLESLTQKVIEVDETVPELPVKDIVFRIYRDVRFSSDQTPYKTAFSGAWSRTGRKGPYAAYYMQIKPNGGSLVAGGLWMPEASALALLRRDIDRRPHRIKQVLRNADIRREFFGSVGDDDRKVVKKFVAQSSENALKTKPKGYESDHKDIDLLRLRSFTLSRKLEDREVMGPHGLERIAELIACLVPFITYLNSVVRPDESSDEDEDSADEEDEDDDGEAEE